jgi:hypothetical protein
VAEIIAYCGLDCGKCRAYIATKTNDEKVAGEIAGLWSNGIEGIYSVDDIWCDGCHSNRLHSFCANCPVRVCANDKGLANCGECVDFLCDKLQALYDSWIESSPLEAKMNLEKLQAENSK